DCQQIDQSSCLFHHKLLSHLEPSTPHWPTKKYTLIVQPLIKDISYK
uniref:Uncharacterized protein n=1 Tax=Amphimedon queenslandica TaxID=400682 RepID=A0A1X7VF22_AMPQE